jgi:SAM-dependent methyltransferase
MKEELERLQEILNPILAGMQPLRLLEAGCGSASRVTFPPHAHVTGIDISRAQLERNEFAAEKIQGDLQTRRFPEASFDAIICWDVLEHLSRPLDALGNFDAALAPNGLLVLALPDVLSLKGLITRLTPHRFHVFIYRYFLGAKDAGLDGNAPFKTHLRFVVSYRSLLRWAERHRLAIVHSVRYEHDFVQWIVRGHPLLRFGWRLAAAIVGALTLGGISTKTTDIIIVARKTATP